MGSEGFISKNLLLKLNNKQKVLCIDKIIKKKTKYDKNLIKIKCDISNYKEFEKKIDKYINGKKIDTIWHLAANSDIQKGSNDVSIDINDTFFTTANLSKYLLKKNIKPKQIIFASSSAVYGEQKGFISENSTNMFPISFYGAMKNASESLLSSLSHLMKIKILIIRFPNVVGKFLTHGLIFDLFKKNRLKSQFIQILGNGKQKKQYLHVEDLIRCIMFIKKKQKKKFDVFNIGPQDNGITVKEIVNIFLKLVSSKKKAKYEKKDYGWPGDVKHFVYSISKAKKIGCKLSFKSISAIQKSIEENK